MILRAEVVWWSSRVHILLNVSLPPPLIINNNNNNNIQVLYSAIPRTDDHFASQKYILNNNHIIILARYQINQYQFTKFILKR